MILRHHIDIGHGSKYSTYKSLKKHYQWPDMRKEIYETVAKCLECALFNNKATNSNKHYFPLLIGEAMERIGIDTVGPLSTTLNGNRYILVGIDYLTKYIFLKATKTKTADEIANFIYEDIILIHGCPSIILTDNGREYKNELVNNSCKKFEINKRYSTPYKPSTNGLVKRTNKTIISMLAFFAMMKK